MIIHEFGDGITLQLPSVAMTNFAWCELVDTTGNIVSIDVTMGDLTERRTLHNGKAMISLLPFMRSAMSLDGDMFPNLPSITPNASRSAFNKDLNLSIAINDADGIYADTELVVPAIYGGTDAFGVYAEERWITYSKPDAQYVPCVSYSLDSSTNITLSYMSSQFGIAVTATGTLSNLPLPIMVTASAPNAFTATLNKAHRINGDNRTQVNDVKLHIVQDKRTMNVLQLRWIDTEGKVNYRQFAKGEYSESTSTQSTYERAKYNRQFNEHVVDIGNDQWQNKTITCMLSFGDDAIPMEQYKWLASLCGASIIELYLGAGKWQRVNIQDTALAVDTRKHLFNFNGTIMLPNVEGQQW